MTDTKTVREKALAALQSSTFGTTKSYLLVSNAGKVAEVSVNDVCHAKIFGWDARWHKKGSVPLYYATNCSAYSSIPEEMVIKFLDWVTDTTKSPWRDCFQGDWELVKDDEGKIKGIIFDPEVLPTLPRNLWFNLSVVLRQAGPDGRSRLPCWDFLTNEGIDPCLAWMLAEPLYLSGGSFSLGGNNSNHASVSSQTSVVNFRNGDYDSDSENAVGIWDSDNEKEHLPEISSENLTFNTVRGRFATTKVLDTDSLRKLLKGLII